MKTREKAFPHVRLFGKHPVNVRESDSHLLFNMFPWPCSKFTSCSGSMPESLVFQGHAVTNRIDSPDRNVAYLSFVKES